MNECCLQFLGEAPRFFHKRLEAQIALFDRVRVVPGAIVELGVGSGVSLRGWAHLVSAHGPNRVIWAFDTFAGFPSFASEDGPLSPALGKRVGGETELRERPATRLEVEESLTVFPSVRVTLVEGDIAVTLRKTTPPAPLALIFCDADTYGPTKDALDVLWPRLAPGGLIVFDEYGHQPWPGETKAVDDFLAANPTLTLERLDMESGPTACILKP